MPKLTEAMIQRRIAKLQLIAKKLIKKDKTPAIKKIIALMKKTDVSLSELRSSINGKKPGAKSRSISAKYKDPKSKATWSGRGRTPLWLVTAEKAGLKRDKFLILS